MAKRQWLGRATNQSLNLVSIVLVLFLLIVAGAVCGLLRSRQHTRQESLQATADVEAYLTQAYGTEVSSAIERFELQWHSLEAYTDLSVQSNVATGQYLHYFNWVRGSHPGETSWSYTTLVFIENVRVLEYVPGRFKAIADVTRERAAVTPGGEFLGSQELIRTCGIYVFFHRNGAWKLAGFFNLSPPPEDVAYAWDYAADWLKDIIGELPDEFDPCDRYGE